MASIHTPQTLPGKVATYGIFTALTLWAFVVAVGFAPVVVPIQLFNSIGLWYFGLLSLASSLAISFTLGIAYGLLFPHRTLGWSILCSASVASCYLMLAQWVRSGASGHIWWTPFSDASLLLVLFSMAACLSAKVHRAYAI